MLSTYLSKIAGNKYYLSGPGFESRWRCMFFTLIVLLILLEAGDRARAPSPCGADGRRGAGAPAGHRARASGPRGAEGRRGAGGASGTCYII